MPQQGHSGGFPWHAVIFTAGERAGLAALIIVCLAGALGNAAALTVLRANRALHNVQGLLLASLSLADFGLCLSNGVMFLIQASSGYFAIGWTGCQLQAFTSIWFCGASVSSIALISWDRYNHVVRNKRTTWEQAYFLLFAIWTYSIALGAMSFVPGLGTMQQESRFYCTGDWTTGVAYPILCLLTLLTALNVTLFFYYKIFKAVREAHARVSSSVNLSVSEQAAQAENTLAKRFSLLVLVFGLAWGPYFISFFYSMFTGKYVVGWYDMAATTIAFSNSAINPVIYAKLDKRFGETAKLLFQCKSLDTTSLSKYQQEPGSVAAPTRSSIHPAEDRHSKAPSSPAVPSNLPNQPAP